MTPSVVVAPGSFARYGTIAAVPGRAPPANGCSVASAAEGGGRGGPALQSDVALRGLRDIIMTGELAPGSLISERDMVERLGVGRTPLREALVRLSESGFVKAVPRHGYFAADLSYTDLEHGFEMRRCLEAFGVRLAAERATPGQLAALNTFLDDARSGMDSDEKSWNIEMDRRFHGLVAEASGNPYLVAVVADLFDLSVRLLYTSHRKATLVSEELDLYEEVVRAIAAGDADRAETGMRSHLELSPLGSQVGAGQPELTARRASGGDRAEQKAGQEAGQP